MLRSNVVLPEPLAPSNTITSPRVTFRFIFSRTRCVPKLTLTSRTEMIGSVMSSGKVSHVKNRRENCICENHK